MKTSGFFTTSRKPDSNFNMEMENSILIFTKMT